MIIGRATSAAAYMDGYDKTYQVRIRFGRTTDTMDHTGTTIEERPLTQSIFQKLMDQDYAPIRDAVLSLTSIHEQTPPMYSAVKIDGRPLYEYARAGKTVERKSRSITVYTAQPLHIAIDENGLFADVKIHCTKGTYIRNLAEDVGRITGLLAHAETLTRLQSGPFNLEDAHPWSDIVDALAAETILPLLPVEQAFAAYARIDLDEEQNRRMTQGQQVRLPYSSASHLKASDAVKPGQLMTIFGPLGFTGLAHCIDHSGDVLVLAAERMFADLENYHE
jgi:tRNA pseudouridine55 synthase